MTTEVRTSKVSDDRRASCERTFDENLLEVLLEASKAEQDA